MSINRTYRVFRDDGRLGLSMNFPNKSDLHELKDDWYFISHGANVVSFEDRRDKLVFQQQ